MWLLLDECDSDKDAQLAAHIINVHQGRVGPTQQDGGGGSSSRQQAGASSSTVSHRCGMGVNSATLKSAPAQDLS